jgi:lysozyme
MIEDLLKLHEGVRRFPYKDTKGNITIGIGRNLTGKGLSESEIYFLLENDINEAQRDLFINLSWTLGLDKVRQVALIDMCFNMGIKGLLTFKNTLPLIKNGKYEQAAKNLRKSKWYKDVKSGRGERIIGMIVTGKWPEDL